MLWTIRPDHIAVLPGVADGAEAYPAEVDDVADIGTLTTLTVRLGDGRDHGPELRVRTTATVTLAPGDPCHVRMAPADITAWPASPAPAPGDTPASAASRTR